jgi:hypothetical protein
VPSAPKAGTAMWDHPCTQPSRNMSSVLVLAFLLKTRTAKVSLRDRDRMWTEDRLPGRTWARLPKANFPNTWRVRSGLTKTSRS